MPNTDLSSVRKHHTHTQVALRKPLRCGFAVVLCSCLLYGAQQCRAQESQSQDVAEAARQERARREQANKPVHVYTDEDLLRIKILTPEDEARLAAARKLQLPTMQQQTAESLDASAGMPLPLGDIARLYRSAKQATEQRFHLPIDEPVLASPVFPTPAAPSAAPHAPVVISPASPRIVAAHPTVVVAPPVSGSAPLRRVDPFSKRLGHVTPVAPAVAPRPVTPRPVAPLEAPPLKAVTPAAPAIPTLAPSLRAVPAAPAAKIAPALPPVAPSRKAVKPAAPALPNMPRSLRALKPSAPAVPTVAPSLKAVKPAAPMAPAGMATRTITVHAGDSLWKIAEQNLGRGSRWRELLAANPTLANPSLLTTGSKLNLPVDVRTARASKVTVTAGDTLSKIAQTQYGRANCWRCILQANPLLTDANRIYEGQELLLPSRCKP